MLAGTVEDMSLLAKASLWRVNIYRNIVIIMFIVTGYGHAMALLE